MNAKNESWTEYGASYLAVIVDCQDASRHDWTDTCPKSPFAFWDDPAEDIYTLDDGEPV